MRPSFPPPVTTWRSGSTFLGEILASHPDTFYHFEPLAYNDRSGQRLQVRSGPLAEQSISTLSSLLRCDYSSLGKTQQQQQQHLVGLILESYMNWVKQDSSFLMINTALSGNCFLDKEPRCWDPAFLDKCVV